jgi:transitional endoplasmic reticulum ATPase
MSLAGDAGDVALQALQQALKLAPGNLALAEHVGKAMLDLQRWDQAEQFFREWLGRFPSAVGLKLGLAKAYLQQGKSSHAMAIVESLIAVDSPAPSALVMHAWLQYREGNHASASASYRDALERDESAKDPELESLLGIDGVDSEDSEGEPIRQAYGGGDGMDDQELMSAERPQIDFTSVGGMEGVKEQIRLKIIFPLQRPEIYAAYGKRIGGGILMYGPPGCGKTQLARATAGEVRGSFLSVGINDILDMWLGNSEKNLHAIFEKARQARPCVLFFDEIDALGANRADMRATSNRQLINQLLAELDGVQADNSGLLIIGATNAPWHMDPAFRRPGRFDRVIFVPPPDADARREIFRIHLAGKPAEGIDYGKLAAKAEDFSGADVMGVVDAAVESKLSEALRTGRPKPLTTADLLTAIKSHRPTTREWFASARNHALYANEGGVYDDILNYLKIKR